MSPNTAAPITLILPISLRNNPNALSPHIYPSIACYPSTCSISSPSYISYVSLVLSQSILVLDSSPISPSHWPSLNRGSSLTGLLTILPPSLNLVVDLSKFSIQQVLASDPPFPTQISYNHSMIVCPRKQQI